MDIKQSARQAREASRKTAILTSEQKNRILEAMADALLRQEESIISANQRDLERGLSLPAPVLKRLTFDHRKLEECLNGIRSLTSLPDPVGNTLQGTELDRGLELYKVTVPIGVIGIIFESRPDALVQISSLCLKSGNAVLMKGGSEALETNRALAKVITEATEKAGMPAGWLQLLETRDDVSEMLKMDQEIDLIIPRGSNSFVSHIMKNTAIPVMGHAEGLCHTYVDKDADLEMALKVTVDAKTQYVSVCNATETLLVHSGIASAFLPKAAQALREKKVLLKGCPRTCAIVPMEPATEEDWDTEYLDYVLSIRVVDSLDEAIEHVNRHGSGHTEAIITESPETARVFMASVDAADVFWNCSTRFADGYRFGLGAEVGIATGKIHARGPVGLDGLCTYKWMLKGHGDIVADYASGQKHFTHTPIPRRVQEIFKPELIYTAKSTPTPPPMNCNWEDFKAAQTVDIAHLYQESSDHHPRTQARLLHDARHIYGIYQVEDRYVRVSHCDYLGEVWNDSCVEFFFKPAGSKGYFNLEMNAGGHHLLYYIWDNRTDENGEYIGCIKLPPEDGLKVKIKTTLPSRIDPEMTDAVTWRLQFMLPLDIIAKYSGDIQSLDGQRWTCNFYKCGDETSHPHWLSWAPLPTLGFHQPEYFQPLVFE